MHTLSKALLVATVCLTSSVLAATVQSARVQVVNRAGYSVTASNFKYGYGAPVSDVTGSKINPGQTLSWQVNLGSRTSSTHAGRGPAASFDLVATASANKTVACNVLFDTSTCPLTAICECPASSGLQCLINTEFFLCNRSPSITTQSIKFDLISETGVCPLVKNIVKSFDWERIGINENIETSIDTGSVTAKVVVANVQFSKADPPKINTCAVEVVQENVFYLQLRFISVNIKSIVFGVQQTSFPFVRETGLINGKALAGVTAVIDFNTKQVQSFEFYLDSVEFYGVKLNNFQGMWNLFQKTIIDQLKTTASDMIGQQVKGYLQECVSDMTTCIVPSAYLRATPATTRPPL